MARMCKRNACDLHTNFEIVCCERLKEFINDCKTGFGYCPYTRSFYIKQPSPFKGSHRIPYCPLCGKQFPKELVDEWYETLKREYGLDDPNGDSQSKLVPEEFKTDEWWKKRGL
jgi:hypothetical protein